ncbi:hypothetical protein JW897_06455 [Chromobacterium alkanivorans]|uniref:hypothetical protein n=1 Tax=Chromobacterium alkanivorans TaxID=1071719 RepID=UPI001967158B|nr:hypothetical protein [Chromobacterium alkanivorans]MBN3003377.1 hypothetical protein [Chromobacterium alkanivorans]
MNPDQKLKCTRCRHQHQQKDRAWEPDRKDPHIQTSRCPRCGGKNAYIIEEPAK